MSAFAQLFTSFFSWAHWNRKGTSHGELPPSNSFSHYGIHPKHPPKILIENVGARHSKMKLVFFFQGSNNVFKTIAWRFNYLEWPNRQSRQMWRVRILKSLIVMTLLACRVLWQIYLELVWIERHMLVGLKNSGSSIGFQHTKSFPAFLTMWNRKMMFFFAKSGFELPHFVKFTGDFWNLKQHPRRQTAPRSMKVVPWLKIKSGCPNVEDPQVTTTHNRSFCFSL